MAISSECELCGRQISDPKRAKIEGVVMEVCNNCSSKGQILGQMQEWKARPQAHLKAPEEELVDNFAELLRNARQKMNLTIEQLASKISEKDFVVRRIEEHKLKPEPVVAKKLEKFLGLKLYVSVKKDTMDDQGTKSPIPTTDKLTLGDFIKIKKAK